MAIARALLDVVIDGVTISDVQAKLGRRLVAEAGLADRVRVHLADFHRLPFPDASFDVALYLEVTGYSPDRTALYRESARIGGSAFFEAERAVERTERILSFLEAEPAAEAPART